MTALGKGLMGKAVTEETTLRVHEPEETEQNPRKNVLSQPDAALLCFGRILRQNIQLKRWFKNMDSAIEILGTEFWFSCHHYGKWTKEIKPKRGSYIIFSQFVLKKRGQPHLLNKSSK